MADRSIELAAEHFRAGRLAPARDLLMQALRRNPRDVQAASLLVSVLLGLGQTEQAEFQARRAVELAPANPEPRFNLGIFLSRLGRHADAAAAFGQAADLVPQDATARRMQISALCSAQMLPEALAAAEAAVLAAPREVELRAARARVLLLLGRAAESMAALREAQAIDPGSIPIARALCSTALYDDRTTAQQLFEYHRSCGALMEASVPAQTRPWPIRDANPQRPLRIGLLSADLCNHVVSIFLYPLLANLDRERFQVVGYFTGSRPDHVSSRLSASCALWRHAPGLDPAQLAEGIRADQIDILLELGGYTSDSPIEVMLHRAAPVQASYLGYPSSAGLTRIDFRLVDSLTDPPASGSAQGADALATERLIRLDPCFLCFPPPPAELVARLGAAPSGQRPFTFGSFNAFHKINQPLLELWGRILARTPGSRLVIKNLGLAQAASRDSLLARARAAGIDAARLELCAPTSGYNEHLASYAGIDLALDTFPYCGTTTTCESLAMGVPVVSLAGTHHAARVGLSLLSAAGAPDLAATSADEYVSLAAALAADPARLREVRARLRSGFAGSTLCDAAAFAARFGDALRAMWQDRCARAG